jgi:hydrogenase/urease accessory protein HupE
MKPETLPLRGYRLLWGFLLLALILSALPAQAHPLPLSYVDLRLDREGLEASVEAPAVDLAHDLPPLSAKALLSPDTLQAHQQEIVALLTSRLTLSASGKTLSPSVEGIAPVLDQKDVRLRLRYVWSEPPARLHIQCQLFPYDPSHQTYVDIYEGQALKREVIFDSRTPQQDYVLGSHQSVASVVRQFLIQGVYHIFTGPDHILFIIGLLLLGGTLKQLLKIVTAFTVVHSVTLCLSALNILSPPARIIEPTIALSIVFVGVHSIVMRKKHPGEKSLPDARLLFAFGFGFIHGFGFANALRELELPRQALVAALFAFNLGVECGQACIVVTVAPLLALLHRQNNRIARRFVTAGSLAVIAAGGFWFVQRVLTG